MRRISTRRPGTWPAWRTCSAVAGVQPSSLNRLAFFVIAPKTQIDSGIFADLVTKPSIQSKVANRIASYNGEHDEWFHSVFLPMLEHIELELLSWEDILEFLSSGSAGDELLRKFYEVCLQFQSREIAQEELGRADDKSKYKPDGLRSLLSNQEFTRVKSRQADPIEGHRNFHFSWDYRPHLAPVMPEFCVQRSC
jgi:hypothetical protein